MKLDLENRIKELTAVVEQSFANHNALVGRLAEARSLLESFLKTEAEKVEQDAVAAAENAAETALTGK